MRSQPGLPAELHIDSSVGASRQELAAVWELLGGADPLAALEAPDNARIEAIRQHVFAKRSALTLVHRRQWLAVAASVIILAVAGLLYTQRPVVVAAENTALEALLPDGSTVALTPQSSVLYARGFGDGHRQIALDGSAEFDVESSATPFVVTTPDLTVTVLGTQFSIDVADGVSAVFVTEGEVEVTANGESRRLAAGDGVILTKEDGSLVDYRPAAAPDTDLFLFIKQPLGVMFDAVENLFDIEIIADERIRAHVHNFKHETSTADSLVSDLCRSVTAMDLRYRKTATGFEILAEE